VHHFQPSGAHFEVPLLQPPEVQQLNPQGSGLSKEQQPAVPAVQQAGEGLPVQVSVLRPGGVFLRPGCGGRCCKNRDRFNERRRDEREDEGQASSKALARKRNSNRMQRLQFNYANAAVQHSQ